jgi:hypothetical protein
MFEPEYRVGFRVLVKKIGFLDALGVTLHALLKSLGMNYEVDENAEESEKKKAEIKNHFKLLALMYKELRRCYKTERSEEIIRSVMMEGGQVFFRGFTPLGSHERLRDFVRVYTDFERHNIVFDVVEETDTRFEIVIRRCLVFESFKELEVPELSQWMCDIASEYFKGYHPRMRYEKDRMIARGDDTCHEVFTWQ